MISKKPHILYLHAHDMGQYCQPYGYAIETPAMMKLAQRGVLFRQMHCAGPTCSASRAGLLTGQSPHSAGMLGLAHRGWNLNDYSQHLVHTLRTAGYHSTLCGFQHVIRHGEEDRIGYDEVIPFPSLDDPSTAEAAAHWLNHDAPSDRPWFLSVGLRWTHRPFDGFDPTQPHQDPRYTRPPTPLPDTPRIRQDMAEYNRRASIVDRCYGQVLDTLDALHLTDNTLVICTTDHGIPFPKMKCRLTNHGSAVLFILAGPGDLFSGGKVTDALLSHIDVFPTLCEHLNIDPPAWLEGKSFLPILRGEVEEINEEIHGEVTYHGEYEPMRSVRTQRYNYIRRFAAPETTVLRHCDNSLSKETLLEYGWDKYPQPAEQLYDLIHDPIEACNLAEHPAYAEILTDMRQRLNHWMTQTNDPLLTGPVPPPK